MIANRGLAAIVIPARLESGRLPRKVLLEVAGRSLLRHAIDCARAVPDAVVYVATDSLEVAEAASRAGAESFVTGPAWCGTRRCYDAWQLLGRHMRRPCDVVVNLQADMVGLEPAALGRVIAGARARGIATLVGRLAAGEWDNPDVVKALVRVDSLSTAVETAGLAAAFERLPGPGRLGWWTHHVGVYAFARWSFARFAGLEESERARTECLEQLRWLEAGAKIAAVALERVPLSINSREDYDRSRVAAEYVRDR